MLSAPGAVSSPALSSDPPTEAAAPATPPPSDAAASSAMATEEDEGDVEAETMEWACPVCTFYNLPLASMCEVCV